MGSCSGWPGMTEHGGSTLSPACAATPARSHREKGEVGEATGGVVGAGGGGEGGRVLQPTHSRIYFAMEYTSDGELFVRLTRRTCFPEPVVRREFQQLITTVEYFCHSRGVYHHDIKPDNLLLDGTSRNLVGGDGQMGSSPHGVMASWGRNGE